MTEAEAYSVLTQSFQDVFMRNGIVLRPETMAKDVDGWDSFKQVEILLTVEEKLGIKFTSKEMDSLECVGHLVQKIISKMDAA